MGGCTSAPASSARAPKSEPSTPRNGTTSRSGGTPRNGEVPLKFRPRWSAATAADILPACETIRLLGEGSFGTVVLVRERSTQQLFAVKVMNKSQLVYEGQLDNVVLERRILREAGPHPFIVECHSGFQTSQAVVLVLEYVPGGDMYDLLRKHGCLQEDHARFYLSEIVVALAELHRHNFVFRDLKLENILIDTRGHVRLTDFGLAGRFDSADATDQSITDISGTAIYQAPEILDGKGHGRVVDWWALGVLAYVLLAGRPPFSSESRETLYNKILTQRLDLNSDAKLSQVSDVGKDLIMRLLDKNPHTRLGSAGADAKDVQSHPFFEDIDWDAVSSARLKPPLAPGLEPRDTATNPDDAKIAQKKLAEKILRKNWPKRAAINGNSEKELDAGEYKMVQINRKNVARRVSIGLDFEGINSSAATKTWTGTANDFGRNI